MSEKLIPDSVVVQLRDVFGKMQHPVQLILFTAREQCEYCEEARQLLDEVAATRSDLIGLTTYDLHANSDVATKFNIDKAPGIVIAGRDDDQIIDYGIQYAGLPSGHEFATLVNAILIVSSRDSGLNQQTREYLQRLEKPAHLQVFVTPT